MANIIQSLFGRQISKAVANQFNRAFYGVIGKNATSYDANGDTYLEQGFLNNPVVYSVIKQRSDKARQIPFYVKKVKDESAKKSYQYFVKSVKWSPKPYQFIKQEQIKAKAFDEEFFDFPLERPNPLQTWGDIVGLYETNMAYNGNCYLYMLKGEFKSEPLAVYVLPSHMVEIVMKTNASMLGLENPIDHYMLIEGNRYVKFDVEDIIHIKYPNPEYDMNGAHLYGLSPLRAALRNIQSSNLGIDLNVDTMLNGGAFGFIHGKNGMPLNKDQADEIKDRMTEMRASKDVLGKISGASGELGFTQIRLSAKEMELFQYFKFDEKQICNALGWSDLLLNNDDGAKYDNVESAERRCVVNTSMPSLQLLDEALTDKFLPLFKGYDKTVLEHDPSDLPEMQQDMETLMKWLSAAIDKGVISRDESRDFLKLPKLGTPEMEAYTVLTDVIPLGEAISTDFGINDQAGV
jgi:HK97 family phage portal protein